MNLIASFGIDFRCLPIVVVSFFIFCWFGFCWSCHRGRFIHFFCVCVCCFRPQRLFAFDQAWIMACSNVYYRVIINGSASSNNRDQESACDRVQHSNPLFCAPLRCTIDCVTQPNWCFWRCSTDTKESERERESITCKISKKEETTILKNKKTTNVCI